MEKLSKTPSIPQKPILTSRPTDASPPFLGHNFAEHNIQSFASTPEQDITMSRLSIQQQSSERKSSSSSSDDKVFPISELIASTAFTSSESDQPDLEYLQGKKEKLALLWLDLNLFLCTIGIGLQIEFYTDLTVLGKAFYLAYIIYITASYVLVGTCHRKSKRHLIWIPLLSLELQYIVFDLNQSFNASSWLADDASVNAREFMSFVLNSVDYFTFIGFFQNTLLVLHYLEEARSRKYFLSFIALVILCFQAISVRGWSFPESYHSSKDFFVVFCLANALALNLVFVASVVNLQTIQRTLFRAELEENRKFKCMFNAIQDGVVLLEDSAPRFINSFALKVFDEALENSSGDHSLSVYDQPIFFPFQPSSESTSLGEPGVALSICELMSYEPRTVGETTFTTSQSISECSRMDQVHKIIASPDAAEKAHFFSIRFLKVNRYHSKKEKADSIMVQIQDISSRVQGQFMKLERQYLSLMNSTVSHEMRNPLNALVSQIVAQEKRLEELEEISLEPQASDFQSKVQAILKSSQLSLTIAKSSTKLLKFNVEDILALPQLKQGRFTKQFSLTSLKTVVSEVVQIMDFQAREKEVEVAVEYQGFWESPDGEIHINLDEQRFQQVLLNYLSNGLKFTERSGSILILLQYIAPFNIREEKGQFEAWEDRTSRFWECRASSRGMHFCSDSFSESSSEGSKMSQDQVAKYIHLQEEATKAIFDQELSPKLVVTVADTGVGIKVEEQTRLFKLFGTIKRTRSVNTRGVGLGLSISKMICEEFGGSVSLKSLERVGSAFIGSFVLDQSSSESQEEEIRCTQASLQKRVSAARHGQQIAIHQQSSAQVPTVKESRSKIIIVDDEAYNCEVLKAMITQLNIPNIENRLRVFMSGTEALQSVHQMIDDGEELKVLLTDLSMPIMDGYSLMHRVRKLIESREQQQPMIAALTGHTETEFISKAYKKGVDHVYSKPISLEQIKLVLIEGGVFMEPSGH